MGSSVRVIEYFAYVRAPVSALPPPKVTWSSPNLSFIFNSGPKRALVSGGEERTEGARKTNKAQLAGNSESLHTKYSQDVRGKAKGGSKD